MSPSPPSAGIGPSIPLRFSITTDDLFRMGREVVRTSRWDWIRRLGAVGTTGLAIHFAFQSEWLVAALTAVVACQLWMRHRLMEWLLRRWLNGAMNCELVVDQVGVRGELQSQMRLRSLSESKRFNYAWNRLRKIERVSDCLVFEFHGGSGTIIPVVAFADEDDLRQCEAWAESGLTQQRKKSA
jgi:hypothetical protein